MIRKWLAPLAVFWFLAVCLAPAQQQTGEEKGQVVRVPVAAVEDSVPAARRATETRMYEDIEIMRRLLLDKLNRLAFGMSSGGNSGKDPHRGTGAAWVDYDGDGRLDLHLANDGSSHAENAPKDPHRGLGFAVGDVDNDGKIDLFVTNYADEKPHQLYINKGNGTFIDVTTATGLMRGHGLAGEPSFAIEGNYLKGYGAFFSVSLPIVDEKVVKFTTEPLPKPVSPWERVRKELRGEQVETGATPSQPQHKTLVDELFKLMAENGQHFTQLPENENLTLAITLRTPRQECGSCHDAWQRSMPGAGVQSGVHTSSNEIEPAGGKGTGSAPGGNTQTLQAAIQFLHKGGNNTLTQQGLAQLRSHTQLSTSEALLMSLEASGPLETDAQNQALLGDLHLKQGRHKDAVEAYQKALADYQKMLERVAKDDRGANLRGYLGAVECLTKIAQSEAAAGNADQSIRALEGLERYRLAASNQMRNAQQARTAAFNKVMGSTADAASAVPLPSRLILLAPKKLLDMAGAGKVSFEDFKKRATVQFQSYPSPKDKSASSAPAGGPANGNKPAGP